MKDVNKFKKEISILKRKLDESNSNKEGWFTKKEDLKKELADLINQSKELRKKISKQSIKEIKQKRDDSNTKVKELITKLRELRKERKDLVSKLNLNKNPEKIKEQMDKLEETIETQALSFSKEKRIMKNINDLKKIYKEASKITKIDEDIKKLVNTLEKTKKEADGFHESLKALSVEGKQHFEKFADLSKKINKIKKEQEEAFDKFIQYKKEFSIFNLGLKEKLRELKYSKEEVDKIKEKKRLFRENIIEKKKLKKIGDKAKEVEKKLMDKKKLTTEDLIVFQEEN